MLMFSSPEIPRQAREEGDGKEARLGSKKFLPCVAAVEDKFNRESQGTGQYHQDLNLCW